MSGRGPASWSQKIPGYSFVIRDWQTLEVIGRITKPVSATWNHRLYGASDFRISFYDDEAEQIRAADLFVLTAGGELAVEEHVVEIRRNGELEFAGLVDYAQIDDATGEIHLSGL